MSPVLRALPFPPFPGVPEMAFGHTQEARLMLSGQYLYPGTGSAVLTPGVNPADSKRNSLLLHTGNCPP